MSRRIACRTTEETQPSIVATESHDVSNFSASFAATAGTGGTGGG
jgi:hypothetical protein